MTWLLLSFAFAADSKSLVQFYPSEVLRNEIVAFHPIEGHHFSFEAPQNCGSGSLNGKNPREIKCQFVNSGETKATLNVCDDKKTFCRPIDLKLTVSEKQGIAEAPLKKNEHINKELKKTMLPDFATGTPSEVSAHANTAHQPVFLMISTDWCPPCNESKEYLLPSQSFKTATRDWYKVYVDGDSLGASDWDKAVPYKYYPSFVLLNSHMEEIGRFNGELRQSDFAEWAKEQSGYLNDPISALKTRVVERVNGQWLRKINDFVHRISAEEMHKQEARLLTWALDQEDRGLVQTLIADGEFPKLQEQILQFKINELDHIATEEKKDFKAEKIKIYQNLLKESFQGEHWSAFLESLCEVDMVSCKQYLPQIPDRLTFLNKDSKLSPAERESRLGDEYYSIIEIFNALDEQISVKDFAKQCVDHFEIMQKTSALKLSRASSQGMIACLELAGDFPREEKALKALMAAYPKEPTFLWRMARMRKKQKKLDDALVWIDKAENLAYGYNWFSLQLLKAEVLVSLQKPSEANKVIVTTLAQVQLDPGSETRNQRLVARLRGLQSSSRQLSKN
jgi:hypothetical protein